MCSFLLLGKYSHKALQEISSERTEKTMNVIDDLGGKVKSIYALLGEYDLAIIVDLPDIEAAMRASTGLSRISDISFITFPAIGVEEFDKTMGDES